MNRDLQTSTSLQQLDGREIDYAQGKCPGG